MIPMKSFTTRSLVLLALAGCEGTQSNGMPVEPQASISPSRENAMAQIPIQTRARLEAQGLDVVALDELIELYPPHLRGMLVSLMSSEQKGWGIDLPEAGTRASYIVDRVFARSPNYKKINK